MNLFQKKNIRDVASTYPKFEVPTYAEKIALNEIYGTSLMKKPVIPLSPKLYKEILTERFAKEFTPFMKVIVQEKGEGEPFYHYYNVYVEFYHKGTHHQVCALVTYLDTDTVVRTYLSLKHDIFECMRVGD